jgi:hypothetical protein
VDPSAKGRYSYSGSVACYGVGWYSILGGCFPVGEGSGTLGQEVGYRVGSRGVGHLVSSWRG